MRVTLGGNSVIVPIIDRCADCTNGAIDISQAAFTALGSLDRGVLQTSWTVLSSCSGGDPAPAAQAPASSSSTSRAQPTSTQASSTSTAASSTTSSSPSPTTTLTCTNRTTLYEGDTCWTLALSMGRSVAELRAANPGLNCTSLMSSQVICSV